MTGIRNTLASINPQMLFLGVGTVLCGTGAAAIHGNLVILVAILSLLFAIFAQLCGSFVHRYIDMRRNYREYLQVNKEFAGESMSVVAEIRKAAATAMFLIAATIGITLVGLSGWWALVVGVLVILISWLYYAGRSPLSRTSADTVPPILIFGPVGVIGTMMAQAGATPGEVWGWYYFSPGLFAGFACGFLAANVQLAFDFIFYERDKNNGKNTFCVRHGKTAAQRLVVINGIIALALMVAYGTLQDVRAPFLISLPAIISMAGALCCGMLMRCDRRELDRLIALIAVATVAIFGLLVCVIGIMLGDIDML